MLYFEERILITVKTYPTLSQKYDETVCTAGITEDGKWVRLYPVPFRRLEDGRQYKKYQWVKAKMTRSFSDFRPESHKPDLSNLEIQGEIKPSDNWRERKDAIAKADLYEDLDLLIADAKNEEKYTSLAVFKPSEVIDFRIEADTKEWAAEKLQAIEARRKQGSLFGNDLKELSQFVNKIPFRFSYVFKDVNGRKSTLMIADWEVGALYFNCLKNADSKAACKMVRDKYAGFIQTKDLYFFLGTVKAFHNRAPNPFIIVGVFYPPKDDQSRLFA